MQVVKNREGVIVNRTDNQSMEIEFYIQYDPDVEHAPSDETFEKL